MVGEWDPDFAEWLMLAQVYEVDFFEAIPVPYLAELGDPLCDDLIKPHDGGGGKDATAIRIQKLIIQRLTTGESFSDLLLIGWVCQFWRKNECEPTVTQIAKLMGLSRGAFYRRHTAHELHTAYLTASGKSTQGLPDPDGLDPVQKANLRSRKPGFASLNRDLGA